MSLDDYVALLNSFVYEGNSYSYNPLGIQQSLDGSPVETIANSLQEYAQKCYAANGVIFSLMAVRQLVFSAISFQYLNKVSGELFGNTDLKLLEEPWVGGTTQTLLGEIIQDADLVGNYYGTKIEDEVVRLRPDWVNILLEPRMLRGGIVGYRKAGYRYTEGGINSGNDSVFFLPDEVIHFAPYPDPLAKYRGMSWLTPVIREIQTDGQMEHHKSMFMKNGATPNMVVKAPPEMPRDEFEKWLDTIDQKTRGVRNAYKTMYMAGGADVEVVGKDMKELDFANIQGHGETRLAAAAGVPPIVAGFSEGLQAATYSNYASARRRFADGTMHPMWQLISGACAPIVKQGSGFKLWYDARGIPFLREDAKDAAAIFQIQASSIRTLTDGGFIPKTILEATSVQDVTKLEHSGLFSVQLQPVYKTGLPNQSDPLLTPAQQGQAPAAPALMPGSPELVQKLKNLGLVQKVETPPALPASPKKALPPGATPAPPPPKRDGDGHEVEGCPQCLDVYLDRHTPVFDPERDVSKLPFGPGHKLWDYWTHGEGFAKWGGAAHKWTTLHDALIKAGVPLHDADGLTTNIIDFVFPGYLKTAHHNGDKGGK